MNQLLDRYLDVLDVDVSTRQGYVKKIDKHIRPLLGSTAVGKIDAEILESFYAVLRRCREHCNGRPYVEHRKAGEHSCTPVCRPHRCRGLADSTVRQIHWIISGALDAAVRWKWISINYASQARKPAVLRDHLDRCRERASALELPRCDEAYVFSPALDGRPLAPDTATQRFARMAARLGLDCTLHSLRQYSATELIVAGVGVRTVAGRPGYCGGGADDAAGLRRLGRGGGSTGGDGPLGPDAPRPRAASS